MWRHSNGGQAARFTVRASEGSTAAIGAVLHSMRAAHGPVQARNLRTRLCGAHPLAVASASRSRSAHFMDSIRSKGAPGAAAGRRLGLRDVARYPYGTDDGR